MFLSTSSASATRLLRCRYESQLRFTYELRLYSHRNGFVTGHPLSGGRSFPDCADGRLEPDSSIFRQLDGFHSGIFHSYISDVAFRSNDERSREIALFPGENEVDFRVEVAIHKPMTQ